jgi:hypothetical protein
VEVEALIRLIGSERETLLPFVGSGMTIAAGAPSVTDLARELAARTGVSADGPWPHLPTITRDAEDRCPVPVVQHTWRRS